MENVPSPCFPSYYPNRRAANGAPVLMLNPSLTYTTVHGETVLEFRRTGLERAALIVPAVAFAPILFGVLFSRLRRSL